MQIEFVLDGTVPPLAVLLSSSHCISLHNWIGHYRHQSRIKLTIISAIVESSHAIDDQKTSLALINNISQWLRFSDRTRREIYSCEL